MITEKIKELEAMRAKVAALEQSMSTELDKELAALPARYGFEDAASFLGAFRAAAGVTDGRRTGGRRSTAKSSGGDRRRRARITDETRAEVKKLVGEGKTGAEVAEALGISLPSVHNIKKELGLVKKRKK